MKVVSGNSHYHSQKKPYDTTGTPIMPLRLKPSLRDAVTVTLGGEPADPDSAPGLGIRLPSDCIWVLSPFVLKQLFGEDWKQFARPTDVDDDEPSDSSFAQAGQIETYISASETAKRLGIKTATLRKYRSRGVGPKGYLATGKTRGFYPIEAVVEYQRQLKEGKGRDQN